MNKYYLVFEYKKDGESGKAGKIFDAKKFNIETFRELERMLNKEYEQSIILNWSKFDE